MHLHYLMISILVLVAKAQNECRCNGLRIPTESFLFCGNGTSVCQENRLYLCNKNNPDSIAEPVADCPRRHRRHHRCTGQIKRFSCLRQMKCSCGSLKINQKSRIEPQQTIVCGSELKGQDCNQNVLYRCGRFGTGTPDPVETCRYGCVPDETGARCQPEMEEIDEEIRENSQDNQNVTIKSSASEMDEHEVEFITFPSPSRFDP